MGTLDWIDLHPKEEVKWTSTSSRTPYLVQWGVPALMFLGIVGYLSVDYFRTDPSFWRRFLVILIGSFITVFAGYTLYWAYKWFKVKDDQYAFTNARVLHRKTRGGVTEVKLADVDSLDLDASPVEELLGAGHVVIYDEVGIEVARLPLVVGPKSLIKDLRRLVKEVRRNGSPITHPPEQTVRREEGGRQRTEQPRVGSEQHQDQGRGGVREQQSQESGEVKGGRDVPGGENERRGSSTRREPSDTEERRSPKDTSRKKDREPTAQNDKGVDEGEGTGIVGPDVREANESSERTPQQDTISSTDGPGVLGGDSDRDRVTERLDPEEARRRAGGDSRDGTNVGDDPTRPTGDGRSESQPNQTESEKEGVSERVRCDDHSPTSRRNQRVPT